MKKSNVTNDQEMAYESITLSIEALANGVESHIILTPHIPNTVKRVGTKVFPTPLRAQKNCSMGT